MAKTQNQSTSYTPVTIQMYSTTGMGSKHDCCVDPSTSYIWFELSALQSISTLEDVSGGTKWSKKPKGHELTHAPETMHGNILCRVRTIWARTAFWDCSHSYR